MSVSTDRAREILAAAVLDGCSLRLTGHLDRAEYVAANKAIEALGGKWNRSLGVHTFATDPADKLAAFLAGGAAPKPDRTTEGYVPTPADLAAWVVAERSNVANLPAGFAVLEPSAGDGAFVRAVLDVNPYGTVVAVESNLSRLSKIEEAHRIRRVHARFEDFAATTDERFEAVVMNPPFSVSENRTIWIDHVRLAFGLLRPRGQLVAIVPGGLMHRQDKRHREMRDLVSAHGDYAPLPDGAFKSSGTAVNTVLLRLNKDSV